MEPSVESPSSSSHPNQGPTSFMGSPPLSSPDSDQRFWSSLLGRVDSLLEQRNAKSSNLNTNKSDRAKRLKEDSLLLMRGFDSVGYTLSQLSNNLDNALQGAKDLVQAPTLTEIFQSNLKNSEVEHELVELKQATKRKYDDTHCSEDSEVNLEKENRQNPTDNLKKAKHLAVAMATKTSSLARELKSLKSNICFMQERCAILDEENRRLRNGVSTGVKPEEDDLVRLQMEALLAEKSRLANENANLTRENQCLYQLAEYHQLTSQDLSLSYDEAIGMCLDFSSPPPAIVEGAEGQGQGQGQCDY
ncbi:uncharacterized protein LOC111463807 isoform X2 [Cucurbita moschata]|uniref:Uncharacterized protein LOC111463807 isoform X2 n=1 Tax=Cucurbita moschata TaxID=3662 RepID=A0A6J1HK88_CUCMO|nr:uncharacterized protein LOC111463807 isoform X2 [Cucurbita moschata]